MTEDITYALAKISKNHDLTCIGINYSIENGWTIYAHWDGYSIDDNSCASGYGKTLEAAMTDVLHRALGKRQRPISVADLSLTYVEVDAVTGQVRA